MRTWECGYADEGMWGMWVWGWGNVGRVRTQVRLLGTKVQKGRNTRRKNFSLDRENRGNGFDT